MEFTFDKLTDEDAQVIHDLLIENSWHLYGVADQLDGEADLQQYYRDRARKLAGIALRMTPEGDAVEPGSTK